jgi:hypothetical protein
MNDKIQQQIDALTRRARESRMVVKKKHTTRTRSSLHQIIRTKEQAETFMKMLKSA